MEPRTGRTKYQGRNTKRGWRQRIAAIAALFCLLVSGACSNPAPVVAGDPDRARVISLVPAATEMLFAIGAGPDVVGVSSFDRFPPDVESLPKVGALVDPDFERILALRPTLVIVYASQTELISRLQEASIGAFPFVHATDGALADVPRLMRELGAGLGRADAAEAEADRIERELDAIRTRAAARPHPATVLIFGREPGSLRGIYASGGVGFLHEILEVAGGRNIFADVPRESVRVTAEMMLTRKPEVIIELRTADPPGGVDGARADWSRLASIPAVRTGRIHILTDPALSIPGPRVVDAVRTVHELLHGQ
jgi:iron complex transport system substrate-binding protein